MRTLTEADSHKVYNIVHLTYRAKNYEGQSTRFTSFPTSRCVITGRQVITTRCARCAIRKLWHAQRVQTECPLSTSRGMAASE